MKTSIAISLLAMVAPICAVPMEALDPRHYTLSESVVPTLSLPVGPPIHHPTGSEFYSFSTLSTHHHKSHKTGGVHSHYPTGYPFPPHVGPTGTGPHPTYPHPTGGHHGPPRYEFHIHPPFLVTPITYTAIGPKSPLLPRTLSSYDGSSSRGELSDGGG